MFYVYQILNKKNGKKYIGQTDDKERRKYQHFLNLKNGTHDNPYLQSSYNKYGEENFVFSVIDTSATNEKELSDLEEYYILQAGFPDRDKCYNLNLPNGVPARHYKIYQEKQEDICNDYKNDMTVNQICKKYDIGLNFLYKILKNNNITIGQRVKRLDIYEQANNIIEYFTLDKMTATDIAKKYDVSSEIILRVLKKNGVDVAQYKNYRHPIWQKANKICQSYLEKKSLKKVSEKYDVSPSTIRRILLENNVEMQEKNWKRKDIDEQEVCSYYEQGLSSRAISKKYNCDKTTILNIIRRNGIQPHKNTTKFKKGNIPYNKGNSIIDKMGGIDYLYKHKDNDINDSTIRKYLYKKGVGVKEFFDLSFAQTSLVDYPDEVCLCLNTKSCKNNCVYCFNKALTMGNPLSFDVAKLAIDSNIQYVSSLSITGGEPLLNNDLSQIIDYAHNNNLKTKIDTSLNGDINNISSNIDLINISIKNYSYLLSILDNINYLVKNHYCCEFNLVYHNEYIDKEECKKINNIISSYNIPLVLVEMDVSYCDFDESPSRDELIELSSLFDVEDIYIQTKQHGREKL